MTVDLILRKVEAEKDVAPRFGIYRLYSFLMDQLNDPDKVRSLLLNEYNYTKTDASLVASRYRYYQSKKA
ncbi:hypothetical protein BK010_02465 [Tenericutes bacterium MO-XQ]|nr:hypothetical protein BK010_02465 [Tenericutes bacterium MO-XQ]